MKLSAIMEVLFSKVKTPEQAQALLKISSIGLYIYFVISFCFAYLGLHNPQAQSLLSSDPYMMAPKGPDADQAVMLGSVSLFVVFALMLGLVTCVYRFKSRVVAVMLAAYFILALFWEATTPSLPSFYSFIGVAYNVSFGWCALRAAEAAFRLNATKKALQ